MVNKLECIGRITHEILQVGFPERQQRLSGKTLVECSDADIAYMRCHGVWWWRIVGFTLRTDKNLLYCYSLVRIDDGAGRCFLKRYLAYTEPRLVSYIKNCLTRAFVGDCTVREVGIAGNYCLIQYHFSWDSQFQILFTLIPPEN